VGSAELQSRRDEFLEAPQVFASDTGELESAEAAKSAAYLRGPLGSATIVGREMGIPEKH
jgi:hypothetical protein